MNNIRNFCIVAHIDHGKSTLADRFLELTGTIEKRKMREQYLDQMELERERGITIKLQPVRMVCRLQSTNYSQNEKAVAGSRSAVDSSEFILNLIDTPGHVDFSYEVSRSLAAVEGAILLVDATKGVQAQTLANLYLAQQQGLAIIPAINKIDLPGARVEEVESEIREILRNQSGVIARSEATKQSRLDTAAHGIAMFAPHSTGLARNDAIFEEIYKISAKEGSGVEELLRAVVEKIPSPQGDPERPLRALVFDSAYDAYKGVIAYVRLVEGRVRRDDKIVFMASQTRAEVLEVGIFKPELKSVQNLSAGEIGYIATGLKDVSLCRVGDTITIFPIPSGVEPLPGYQEPKPMIFASFYPAFRQAQGKLGSGHGQEESHSYNTLKDSLSKLKLSDASLVFEPESSEALGRGFKCGFLGMLHMEIVSERLKREYGLNLIVTTPSVVYKLKEKGGAREKLIYSPQQLPGVSLIEEVKEPWIKLEIISPNEYLGTVMKLLSGLGGNYLDTQYLSSQRVIVVYETPLREIIVDFYDKLKGATAGYASMSYELIDWRPEDLVCLDILVAHQKVEALARLVPRRQALAEGQAIVLKLKEALPAQWFTVALQAAVGGKILAREDIRARRKDVTGYLYGGDYTRKRKLLEKQKKGKKRMYLTGKVNIPQEVFLKILKK